MLFCIFKTETSKGTLISEIKSERSRNFESKQINSKDSCFCSFVAVDPDQLVVVVAEVEVVAVVDVVDRGGHRGSFLLKRERENERSAAIRVLFV